MVEDLHHKEVGTFLWIGAIFAKQFWLFWKELLARAMSLRGILVVSHLCVWFTSERHFHRRTCGYCFHILWRTSNSSRRHWYTTSWWEVLILHQYSLVCVSVVWLMITRAQGGYSLPVEGIIKLWVHDWLFQDPWCNNTSGANKTNVIHRSHSGIAFWICCSKRCYCYCSPPSLLFGWGDPSRSFETSVAVRDSLWQTLGQEPQRVYSRREREERRGNY